MGAFMAKRAHLTIGWREIVSLPDLGLMRFKAKIDTGARTTALHADHIRVEPRDGTDWVSFHPRHLGIARASRLSLPLHARRAVRNTSGVPEERYVVRTHLALADRLYLIELTLADRSDMAFPMIIGRTALRGHRILVDPGRSFLTTPPAPTPQEITP